jgi:hypothetical protein
MQIALHCPGCAHDFWLPSGSPAEEVLNQVAIEGPWSSLGDGETLEDRVFNVLSHEETTCCPECGGPALPREESLSQFTRELLGNW